MLIVISVVGVLFLVGMFLMSPELASVTTGTIALSLLGSKSKSKSRRR